MNNTAYVSSDYNYSQLANNRSEARIRNNKIRRQRIVRRQYAILIFFITILLILGVFLGTTLMTDAVSDEYTPEFKYYTTVTVHEGDTITKLAQKYYSDNHYRNMNSYIFEICTLNRIGDKDVVKAGESIIVPYYSTEFK